MLVSCSTAENWAIWAMNCELSVGFLGSCIFSCATRIFRNVSLFSALAFLLPSVVAFFVSSVVAFVPSVAVIEIGSAMALGADVDERPGGQLDRAGRGGCGVD